MVLLDKVSVMAAVVPEPIVFVIPVTKARVHTYVAAGLLLLLVAV